MIEVQLAAKLSEDRIDIAIDLAGHTEGNSLQAFSLRMAPIQMSYLGYPDTTGLTQMDYRIVDSLTDPLDPVLDARHTEKLLRIDPCFLCYRPPAEAPDCRLGSSIPNPQSEIRNPAITFGSFNAGRKLSGPVLDPLGPPASSLSQARASSSRLRTSATPPSPNASSTVLKTQGISEDRVEILKAPKGMAEHLALYGRVDIGLDPMPYTGATTTCDALWMGVPVVTLAGNRHAGQRGRFPIDQRRPPRTHRHRRA